MEAGAGFGVEDVFVGGGEGVVFVEDYGADVAVVAEGLVVYLFVVVIIVVVVCGTFLIS